ncbi:RNA-binding domain-containing protein [Auriculariales sp. MPI-PUGE-AT-0066]|nr:RNA-binding domain-containing protein [Auriculariales sp. MPI-PUGE-AT-0066]
MHTAIIAFCIESRLIVKGLPAQLTDSRLREHFASAQKGTVTDVRILYHQDGTSRRFGFIGFKSDAEAAAAKDYFDRSFIGTSRLSVQVVQGTKDAPAPRPNKRPRLAGQKKCQLDAFLQVMQSRTKKGKAWSNEDPSPITCEGSSHSPAATRMSDLEWMRQRMRKTVLDETDKAFEQSDDEQDPPEASTSKRTLDAEEDPTPTDATSTARLFIRNLPYTCTEDELREHFSQQGSVSQVHIPLDSNTKTTKGLAFVTYSTPEEATAAREALDGTTFQGRLLHIIPAIDRRPAEAPSDFKGTLKNQRADQRKKTAGKDFNWAMLYMNADAVASSIADRMKIDKAAIVGADSENAAVKLALAETHIINETKKFFEDEGVNLESFTSKARSDTVILVKNIPYGTSTDELREMFAPHGSIIRLLLPPAGTIAVVERPKAMKSVAYKRLKNSIIYLERGPLEMFTGTPKPKPSASQSTPSGGGVVRLGEGKEAVVAAGAAADEAIVPAATLFVKNLAWATTSDRLRSVFGHLPGFKFARVQQKPDPKRPGQTLSAGYGFVGFVDPDAARKGLASMQGHVLDGHELAVKFAGRGQEDDQEDSRAAAMGGRKSAKMIVKNVPFEATKKDLRELFGVHGHLKSVRLPKKFNSRSRGFAFLEFVSRQEAEHAFATLRHTHFLGRHLVLEWAAEPDVAADVEALREKVRAGFGDGKELPGRKRKLEIDEDDAEVEEE